MWVLPYEWLRRHTAGAVRQGISFDSLMGQSMIELQHGDDRDVVGPAQAILLCMNTTAALEDAAHGLARASIIPCHSALSLNIALGCGSLEAAINAVAKFYETVSTAARFKLETSQEYATVSVQVDARYDGDGLQLEETYLTWLYMHCMYFLGHSMPVIDVSLRDPRHYSLGQRHLGIGAVVRAGTVTSLRFARSLLGARSNQQAGDNVIWEALRLWLDHVQTSSGVRDPAMYLDKKGFVRLKEMAEQRNVSRSTMRRRLQVSDGGFRGAREHILVETATGMLLSSDESVEAISVELGYADARSFRRFLKNATGLTPHQIRSRGLSISSGGEQRIVERLVTVSAKIAA